MKNQKNNPPEPAPKQRYYWEIPDNDEFIDRPACESFTKVPKTSRKSSHADEEAT
jgi:hypothetical protein